MTEKGLFETILEEGTKYKKDNKKRQLINEALEDQRYSTV